jgi:hypothetical protein
VRELELIDHVDGLFVILDPFLFGSQVLDDQFGFTRVVPEVGSEGFFLLVGNFYLLGINVKDTSSTHQGAPQYL